MAYRVVGIYLTYDEFATKSKLLSELITLCGYLIFDEQNECQWWFNVMNRPDYPLEFVSGFHFPKKKRN